MKPVKFKFELEGLMFQLPVKFLKKTDYSGKPLTHPEIDMNHVAAANVVKQYVKAKYPSVTVSAKSDSFSMGNSVDIYLSDEYGNPVSTEICKDVDRFGSQFEYGRFNGMIDLYEHFDEDVRTDNGTPIKSGVKYLHVNNRASFGTVPDVVRMIKDMMAGGYGGGPVNLNKAVENVKGYGITENNINKALQLI